MDTEVQEEEVLDANVQEKYYEWGIVWNVEDKEEKYVSKETYKERDRR